MEELIDKIYNNPQSPGGFSGIDQLYRQIKTFYPNVTRKDIIKYLENNLTYTLHKPRRIHFKRLKTVPAGFMTDVQCDLGDFQKLSRHNKGFRYLLVCVDVLSRRVFASPTKSKKAKDMQIAFDQLFSEMPMIPHQIFSDRGGEFISREMKSYFKDKGVLSYCSKHGAIKAGVAERAIRNIKSQLYKYFTTTGSRNWVDVIPKITEAINNSYCRVINMSPHEVTFKNAQNVWKYVYGDVFKSKKSPKHSKDQHMRIVKEKMTFRKGYLPNFSDRIYTINKINRGNPTTYDLIDSDNEGKPVPGKFYEQELSKTIKEPHTEIRIEKVYRSRIKNGVKEYYVKFYEDPRKVWLAASDIL